MSYPRMPRSEPHLGGRSGRCFLRRWNSGRPAHRRISSQRDTREGLGTRTFNAWFKAFSHINPWKKGN